MQGLDTPRSGRLFTSDNGPGGRREGLKENAKAMFKDEEIVIRLKKDMINGDPLSRLLDSVNLESV